MKKKRDVAGILREKAVKVTPQRAAVLDFLYENPDHPPADEVYRQVKKRFPYISRATIYNTLKTLTDVGLLQEILVRQEKTHVDWNVSPHHHFKCLSCGRVEDLPYGLLTADQVSGRIDGYEIRDVRVVMEGICKRCR
jgi:Fur family peroxide stress response transcriptional regulator